MNRLLASHLLAVILSLSLASAAYAGFTPATLVSGNAEIPFEAASSPALSQDGRYVVFRGRIDGDTGVFRRDLQTGTLEPVAAGVSEAVDPLSSAAFSAPDAAAPSISAEGQYVAFTSAAELDPTVRVPANDHGCPQVYIRDMDLGPEEPGAYLLASVVVKMVAGTPVTEAIEYLNGCPAPPEKGFRVAGAQAAAGTALSADGRSVVFTVLSPSDLAPGDSEGGGQVAVRDLDSGQTTLVSEAFDSRGEASRGGGAYPSSLAEQSLTQIGGTELGKTPNESPVESFFGEQPTASSASISADGSTVAWIGTDVPQQVPTATDVTAGMSAQGGEAREVEPLWRRIGEGAGAVTKRLLAAAGLNFYFTESHDEAHSVEGGSLYEGSSSYFVPPALSADGTTVATVANVPTAANQTSYAFTSGKPSLPTDAYVVHVNSEPTSQPQVVPLTATPSFDAARLRLEPSRVANVAISPDGSRVGFDTHRTSFALAPPSLISPPAPETSFAYTYEVNLALGTLQQVTSTFDGTPPNGEPGSISFSADGQTLAFSSVAANLIYGTPTSGVSQVYTAHELPSPTAVAEQSLNTPPSTVLPSPDRILSATASVQRDGSVIVDAEVPGPGRLDAQLTAQLLKPSVPAKRSRRKRPRRGRAAVRNGRGTTVRARAASSRHSTSQTTVAQAATVAGAPGEIQLRLRLGTHYRALAYGRYGLYSLLRVTFAESGKAALTQLIPLTVHAPAPLPAGKTHASVRARTPGVGRSRARGMTG